MHSALLVPEILISIAHHLPRRDFLQALLVCSPWHTHLLPLLWHNLVLPQRWRVIMASDSEGSPSGFPNPAVFKKYAHLVRSLDCNNVQYHLHYLVPFCNQLTELDVIDVTEDTLPLLRLNTENLTSILFKREHEFVKRPFRALEFLQAMVECRFLDKLRLLDFAIDAQDEEKEAYELQQRRNNRDRRRPALPPTPSTVPAMTPEEMTQATALFYQIMHRLSTLHLDGSVIGILPIRSDIFYRLRRLALIDSTMSYRDQLQLVSQCQYLTHLKLQFTRELEKLDPDDLAAVDLETACPNITNLDLSWCTLKDQEIAALVWHLPHLISFRAQRTHLGEKTMEMLSGPDSRVKDQLEELDLVDARDMESAWVQRLLCSCSGLRRFRATEINARDILSGAASAFALLTLPSTSSIPSSTLSSPTLPSLSSSSWVCLHLQELQLSIIGISPRSSSSLQEQLVVYDQLSQLTQLQILSLGGNYMSTWFRMSTLELSLLKGFDRLATLRELRVFNFSYMSHELGMSEIEFMMEHWTKLRKVVGTIGISVHEELGPSQGQDGAKPGSVAKTNVEKHEIFIHRKWPLVQFSST